MLEISTAGRIDATEFAALMTRLGLFEDVMAAKTVVIKPNLTGAPSMTAADVETHVFTDPRLLKDIVVGVLELNPDATVHIAESDSTGSSFAYLKFARFGLPDILGLTEEQSGRVVMLDLSRDRLRLVTDERFRYFRSRPRQMWLSETLAGADLVISLSNCKTHVATLFTGACKNLFGCLPGADKSAYHPRVHDVVHDVTLAVSPHLNVVDAFFAMEGNGPIFGRPVDCSFRIFSRDALEADLCACRSAGFAPDKIGYLRRLMGTLERSDKSGAFPSIVRLTAPSLRARAAYRIGNAMQSAGDSLQRYGQGVQRWRRFG